MSLPPSYDTAVKIATDKKINGVAQKTSAAPAPAPARKGDDGNQSVTFTINGESHTVSSADVTTTYPLVSYIREQTRWQGPKRACGEGGCGACTVAYTEIDAATGKKTVRAINSCLHPVLASDGASITTNDGLAMDPSQDLAHQIQKELAAKNGSQCGFCSNGMVTTMWSLLSRNPNPTELEIEREFDGNLCRCTGYRPIMDAFKTFAAKQSGDDAKDKKTFEEIIDGIACAKTGCSKRGTSIEIEDAVASSAHHHHDDHDVGVITKSSSSSTTSVHDGKKKLRLIRPSVSGPRRTAENAKSVGPAAVLKAADNVSWVDCRTLDDLNFYLPWYSSLGPVILAVAQTSQAVLAQTAPAKLYIAKIPEFTTLTQNSAGISIGACVCVNDVINFLKTVTPPQGAYQAAHFSQAVLHLHRVANQLIRNVASLTGNLFLAKHAYEQGINFQSDIMVVLFGLGATLACYDTVLKQKFTIASVGDFFSTDFTGKYVQTINIPWAKKNEKFMTYKVAARRVNAHAYVNAAMRCVFDATSKTISNADQPTVIVGGVFARVSQATAVENAMRGKDISSNLGVQSLLQAAKAAFVPVGFSGDEAAYLQTVATAYVYKFCLFLTPQIPANLSLASKCWLTRDEATTSSQTYGSDPAEAPVDKPMTKMHAIDQTSGKAIYTGDLPDSGPDTLHGALVLAPVANTTLTSIDTSKAEAYPGFVKFLDASVFAEVGTPNQWQMGPIFASKEITFAMQPVGMVLCTSDFSAMEAAKLVVVNHSAQSAKPCVTINEAKKTKKPFPLPPPSQGGPPMSVKKGNPAEALSKAKNKYTGSVEMGWQYHFHLEGQVSHVVPREMDRYEVYSATQMPVMLQNAVASACNVSLSHVLVENRRCGGGYGGKLTNSIYPAVVAAIACKATTKPVYLNMHLKDYMKALGIRGSRLMDYEVAWEDDGTITALNATVYCSGGQAFGNELGTAFVMCQSLDNCYAIPNFAANAIIYPLDVPAVNPCRGPGWVPAIQLMEAVISMVANKSGLPRDTIRAKNFYKVGGVTPGGMVLRYWTMDKIWADLNANAKITQRRAAIATHNAQNRWIKKGLALVPVRFGCGQTGANFDSLVAIYPDGSVCISHGGSEIGQGLNVKVAQCASYRLGLSQAEMEALVQVLPTSTRTASAMSNVTGGSVSSELCGLSVMHACDQLNQRLAPFRKQGMKWADVITAASGAGVPLQATGFSYAPVAANAFNYNSYGAAAVEVEVDTLTGEYIMKRVDLLQDAGVSLNPMIDIGQIEGGFMFGCGYHVFEEVTFNAKTGAPHDATTWHYKPPSAYDVPEEWNTTLLPNAPNPLGVLGSKATGEPGVCLGTALVQALECAVEAQLQVKNVNARFSATVTPFNVQAVQLGCAVSVEDMTI